MHTCVTLYMNGTALESRDSHVGRFKRCAGRSVLWFLFRLVQFFNMSDLLVHNNFDEDSDDSDCEFEAIEGELDLSDLSEEEDEDALIDFEEIEREIQDLSEPLKLEHQGMFCIKLNL